MSIAPNMYFLAIVSCIATWLLFIPFIGFLYNLNMKDPKREKGRLDRFGDNVDIFDNIKGGKVGTPSGGGVLIVFIVSIVFSLIHFLGIYKFNQQEFLLLLSVLLLFGIVGFIDDIRKIYAHGLRVRYKFAIQIIVSAIVTYIGISSGLFYISIPFTGLVITDGLILFALSMLTIIFVSNAFNIVDGIDGLAAGLWLITTVVLISIISYTNDSVTQNVFLFLLMGAVLAFLYFNINPARLFMGDTGALSFGAVLGVIIMTTGTFFIFPIFCFIYVVDAFSTLIQWTSKYFRNGKKVFKIAPLHHHFEALGWEGTKVVFRFWVIHAFFSIVGLCVFFWVV